MQLYTDINVVRINGNEVSTDIGTNTFNTKISDIDVGVGVCVDVNMEATIMIPTSDVVNERWYTGNICARDLFINE
jgi:hypothetical protein